jgi:hypothetical protein
LIKFDECWGFNVNASFVVVLGIYFTLDLGFGGLGFLRVGEGV